VNSVSESRSLAQAASSYISSRGTSDSLYQAYWSTNTASRISGVFNAVANENSSSRTLDCTDPYSVCSGGVIAYTVIATTNVSYRFVSLVAVKVLTRVFRSTSAASSSVKFRSLLFAVVRPPLLHATPVVELPCTRSARHFLCFCLVEMLMI
jgi:deuterolysin